MIWMLVLIFSIYTITYGFALFIAKDQFSWGSYLGILLLVFTGTISIVFLYMHSYAWFSMHEVGLFIYYLAAMSTLLISVFGLVVWQYEVREGSRLVRKRLKQEALVNGLVVEVNTAVITVNHAWVAHSNNSSDPDASLYTEVKAFLKPIMGRIRAEYPAIAAYPQLYWLVILAGIARSSTHTITAMESLIKMISDNQSLRFLGMAAPLDDIADSDDQKAAQAVLGDDFPMAIKAITGQWVGYIKEVQYLEDSPLFEQVKAAVPLLEEYLHTCYSALRDSSQASKAVIFAGIAASGTHTNGSMRRAIRQTQREGVA